MMAAAKSLIRLAVAFCLVEISCCSGSVFQPEDHVLLARGSSAPPTQQNPAVAPPVPITGLSSDYISNITASKTQSSRRALNSNGAEICSPTSPCADGSCCKNDGICGFGPTYCGSGNCTSNCDATAMCGRYSDDGGTIPCGMNLCCSYYGWCGTTENHCGNPDPHGLTPCQSGFGLCHTVPPPSCAHGGGSTNGRTIGYYQASNVRNRVCNKITPSQIQTANYTRLYFAFANFDPSSYAVQPADSGDVPLYTQFTSLQSSKLQTWIAVGGFDFSDPGTSTYTAWSNMTSTSANRAAFISSLKSFMAQYKFQGVDLDWEYPSTPERGGERADMENYVALVKEMRASFGSQYGISLTLAPDYWYLRGFDAKAMEQYVDFFGFMAYDLHGFWDADVKTLGAQIRGQTDIRDISNDTLPLWFDNLTPSKINFGLAYYGRGYTLADASCNTELCPFSGPSKPGPCTNFEGLPSLREIQQVIDENKLTPTLLQDSLMKSITWDGQWMGYDDPETWALKKPWADGQCFGGTMAWSVDFYSGAGRPDTANLTERTIPDPSHYSTYNQFFTGEAFAPGAIDLPHYDGSNILRAATSAIQFTFQGRAATFRLTGLYGCTSLIVVSRRGIWLSRSRWSGCCATRDTACADDSVQSLKLLDSHTAAGLTSPTEAGLTITPISGPTSSVEGDPEAISEAGPLNGQPWVPALGPLTQDGAIFDPSDPENKVRAIIVTPENSGIFTGNTGPYDYGPEVDILVSTLRRGATYPGTSIEPIDGNPQIISYTRDKEDSKDPSSPVGKVLVQYDPESVISRQIVGTAGDPGPPDYEDYSCIVRRAGVRVWVTDSGGTDQAAYEDTWTLDNNVPYEYNGDGVILTRDDDGKLIWSNTSAPSFDANGQAIDSTPEQQKRAVLHPCDNAACSRVSVTSTKTATGAGTGTGTGTGSGTGGPPPTSQPSYIPCDHEFARPDGGINKGYCVCSSSTFSESVATQGTSVNSCAYTTKPPTTYNPVSCSVRTSSCTGYTYCGQTITGSSSIPACTAAPSYIPCDHFGANPRGGINQGYCVCSSSTFSESVVTQGTSVNSCAYTTKPPTTNNPESCSVVTTSCTGYTYCGATITGSSSLPSCTITKPPSRPTANIYAVAEYGKRTQGTDCVIEAWFDNKYPLMAAPPPYCNGAVGLFGFPGSEGTADIPDDWTNDGHFNLKLM